MAVLTFLAWFEMTKIYHYDTTSPSGQSGSFLNTTMQIKLFVFPIIVSFYRSFLSAFCVTVLFFSVSAASRAADKPLPAAPQEYEIKAGFLYNFIVFTHWPSGAFAGSADPLNVYIACDASIMPAFGSLSAKKVKSRSLQIKQIKPGNSLPDDCHVLFIAAKDMTVAGPLLSRAHNRPILTVGQTDGFLESGGIINLFTKKNKIRFAVNIKAAQQAGLKLSSHMLKLARLKK